LLPLHVRHDFSPGKVEAGFLKQLCVIYDKSAKYAATGGEPRQQQRSVGATSKEFQTTEDLSYHIKVI
jgi:hypothetical protein